MWRAGSWGRCRRVSERNQDSLCLFVTSFFSSCLPASVRDGRKDGDDASKTTSQKTDWRTRRKEAAYKTERRESMQRGLCNGW